MVALSVDIQCFVIGLHARLVASICEVEGYVKKINNLFVSVDCDLKAISSKHMADLLFDLFNFISFQFQ